MTLIMNHQKMMMLVLMIVLVLALTLIAMMLMAQAINPVFPVHHVAATINPWGRI